MSNLINKTRLQKFATDLWAKIKGRYDVAFKEATISASESADKKITLTRISETNPVDVSLADYARLQDRNEFKKDVSVDDAKIVSNKNIGSLNGPVVANTRTTGYRSLSSASFTDRYVKTLRIYAPTNGAASANFHIWTIKKGKTKEQDKLLEDKKVSPATIVEGDGVKYYDISIERKYTDDVFFVVRTDSPGANIEGINKLKAEIVDDVINLNDRFNPSGADTLANWSAYDPTHELAGHMELHGRTGIVDLSKRLDEIDTASGNYVKHSECTVQGGNASDNGKVVKLGTDGKLHESLMPKIALNEYYEVAEFTHAALGRITYENGDVVVVNSTGNPNNGKRYLCIKKDKNPGDLREGFVELNAKDGIVTSVNELRGDINLALAAEVEKIKLNITSGGTVKTSEIPVITDAEIEAIISGLN